MKRKNFDDDKSNKRPKLESPLGSMLDLTKIKLFFDQNEHMIFNRWKSRFNPNKGAKNFKAYCHAQFNRNPQPSNLHKAILNEDLIEIKTELDRGTISINENKNDVSIPPFHWACGIGNPQVINLLIASGANPQMVDGNGNTPLAYTLCSNNPAAVDELLAHGVGLPAEDLRKLVKFYFLPTFKYESTDCLRHLFKKILLAGNEELALRYMILLWVAGIEELSPYIPDAYLIPLIEEILESDWLLRNFVVMCAPDFLKLISLCRNEIQESVLQKRGIQNDNLAHWGACS